jgi:hypothetical protein
LLAKKLVLPKRLVKNYRYEESVSYKYEKSVSYKYEKSVSYKYAAVNEYL